MYSVLKLLKSTVELYNKYRIPRAAAALCYYLTMTFFPLIICLYTLLGKNYIQIMETLRFVSQFISANTTEMLRSFMRYVATRSSNAMLLAGVLLFLASASAAMRTIQSTIGEMQGEQRFRGISGFLFSLVLALAFVLSFYFSILVLFTGRDFLEKINGILPFIDISRSWSWIRFLLLAGIMFMIVWAMFTVLRRRSDHYRTFPGAAFTSVSIVVMSLIFSTFISASARYSMVYGSLASLILLMYWLYLVCQIIFLGASLNFAVYKLYGASKRRKSASGE